MKGDKCHRRVCNNVGLYYNKSTQEYYCLECARKIQYWSLHDDNEELFDNLD